MFALLSQIFLFLLFWWRCWPHSLFADLSYKLFKLLALSLGCVNLHDLWLAVLAQVMLQQGWLWFFYRLFFFNVCFWSARCSLLLYFRTFFPLIWSSVDATTLYELCLPFFQFTIAVLGESCQGFADLVECLLRNEASMKKNRDQAQ